MEELGKVMDRLYPGAMEQNLLLVRYHEDGPYIDHFDEGALGPQPTQDQIDAEYVELMRDIKKVELFESLRQALISGTGDDDVESTEDLMLMVIPAIYARIGQVEESLSEKTASEDRPATAAAMTARRVESAQPSGMNLDTIMAAFGAYYEAKSRVVSADTVKEIQEVFLDV